MGKVEAFGLVVAVAGLMGAQAADGPSEAEQITTAMKLVAMSRADFEAWCRDRGKGSEVWVGSSEETRATCAWVDRDTGEVWHTALHFDHRSPMPRRADTGLLHASTETVLRLVHNEHGTTDGESVEGFPVWKVEVAGRRGLLAVAQYDELTLVQIQVPREDFAVSMR